MSIRAADVRLTEAAAKSLEHLEGQGKSDRSAAAIVRRVRSLRSVLLADALHGEVVKKPLPRALVAKHGVENLYVEDLPNFWRLLYSVPRLEGKPFVVVVEIVDHASYDEWFPGRGR